MINLATRQLGLVEVGQKYKRWVYVVTTVILVVYLVVVAGSAGWWVWVASRRSEAVRERDELVGKVGQMATVEAVVRQVASRAGFVEEALAGPRQGIVLARVQEAAQGLGLEVRSWQAGVVTVKGSSPQVLEDFAGDLEVKSVTRVANGVWEEEVVWK